MEIEHKNATGIKISTNVTIDGYALDSTGAKLSNVTFNLHGYLANLSYNTSTDGYFIFENVPSDWYGIEGILQDGLSGDFLEKMFDENTTVNFTFYKAAIEIKTDRFSYMPGEDVNVTLNITNLEPKDYNFTLLLILAQDNGSHEPTILDSITENINIAAYNSYAKNYMLTLPASIDTKVPTFVGAKINRTEEVNYTTPTTDGTACMEIEHKNGTKLKVVNETVARPYISANTTTETVERPDKAAYTIVLENRGNYIDTYTINLHSDYCRAYMDTSNVTLDAGEKAERVLTIQGSYAGECKTEVKVTSSLDTAVYDTVIITTDIVDAVDLTADTDKIVAYPNDYTNFTLILKNTGIKDHTYKLNMTKTTSLAYAKLEDTSITLPKGNTTRVNLTVMDESVGRYEINVTAGEGDKKDMITLIFEVTEKPVYGIALTSDKTESEVDKGQYAVYSITFKNTGNRDDTYILTVDSDGDYIFNSSDIQIPAGGQETREFKIKSNLPGEYKSKITATSKTDGSKTSEIVLTTKVIGYGVFVSVSPDSQAIVPNSTATYEIEIKNTGNVNDTYNLSYTTDANTVVSLEKTDVSIEKGEVAYIKMNVTPLKEGEYSTYVIAKSLSNPSVFSRVAVKTSARTTPEYGIDTSTDKTQDTAEVYDSVEYLVTVKNTGNRNDTVMFQVISDTNYTFDTRDISLAPSDEVRRILRVFSDESGEYTTTVKAKSKSDSSKESDIAVNTKFLDVVSLYSDRKEQSAYNGSWANFTIKIENTGIRWHSFIIGIEAPADLELFVSKREVNLSSGESTIFEVGTKSKKTGVFPFKIFAEDKNDGRKRGEITLRSEFDKKPVYGVSLTVDSERKSTEEGKNVSYIITVTNTGNTNDTYRLYVVNTHADIAKLSDTVVKLDASNSTPVILNVSDAYMGIYKVKVVAVSTGDSSEKDEVLTYTKVRGYAPQISADAYYQSISTNDTATYTITVKNGGNADDIIDLEVVNTSDIADIQTNKIMLSPGSEKRIKLIVKDNSTGNYTANITAISEKDPSKKSSIVITTEVVDIPLYNVSLSADNEKTAETFTYAIYRISIKNTGNRNDTFMLNVSSDTSYLFNTSDIKLEPGAVAVRWLRVTSERAGVYTTSIKAISKANPARSSKLSVKTTFVNTVDIHVIPRSISVHSGEPATYMLDIKNTGIRRHTYILNADSGVEFEYDNVTLEQYSTKTIYLNTTYGLGVHRSEIVVKDAENTKRNATSNITTIVVPREVYGVKVILDKNVKYIENTTNATYVVTITNLGNRADNFTINVENIDNATWIEMNTSQLKLNSTDSATRILKVGSSNPGSYRVKLNVTSLGALNNGKNIYSIKKAITVVVPNKHKEDSCVDSDYSSTVINTKLLCPASIIRRSVISHAEIQNATLINTRVLNSKIVNSTVYFIEGRCETPDRGEEEDTLPTDIENATIENNVVRRGVITIEGVSYNITRDTPICDIVSGTEGLEGMGGVKGDEQSISSKVTNSKYRLSSGDDFVGGELVIHRAKNAPENITGNESFKSYIVVEPSANLEDAVNWVLIRVYYDESALEGIDESSLRLRWFNESSGRWEELPGGVNTEENYVWANVSHFSVFGVQAGIVEQPQEETQQQQKEEKTEVTAICGDNVCGSFENCSTCPEDCGTCKQGIYVPKFNDSLNMYLLEKDEILSILTNEINSVCIFYGKLAPCSACDKSSAEMIKEALEKLHLKVGLYNDEQNVSCDRYILVGGPVANRLVDENLWEENVKESMAAVYLQNNVTVVVAGINRNATKDVAKIVRSYLE